MILLNKVLIRHIIDRINVYPRGSVIILLLWMSISIKRSFGNTKCIYLLAFSGNAKCRYILVILGKY